MLFIHLLGLNGGISQSLTPSSGIAQKCFVQAWKRYTQLYTWFIRLHMGMDRYSPRASDFAYLPCVERGIQAPEVTAVEGICGW
jgi:hypothetical protein